MTELKKPTQQIGLQEPANQCVGKGLTDSGLARHDSTPQLGKINGTLRSQTTSQHQLGWSEAKETDASNSGGGKGELPRRATQMVANNTFILK